MNYNSLFKNLAESAQISGEHITSCFLDNFRLFESFLNDSFLINTAIRTHDLDKAAKSIAFSCVFNDATLLTLQLGDIATTILEKSAFQKYFNIDFPRVLITKDRLSSQSVEIENSIAQLSFCGRGDEEANRFYYSLYDLIESGKVIPHPMRTLMLIDRSVPDKPSIHFYEVDLDSPVDEWRIGYATSNNITEIEIENVSPSTSREIFDITIPYIENINFSDLNKIVDDEKDQIKDLKVALKSTIEQAKKESQHVSEIISDVVEPQIRSLNRKFRRIANFDSMKRNGAILTSAAIALISCQNSGLHDAVYNLFATGAAATGFYFQIEKAKNIDDLKDNSFYFLWKCKNL